jgi:type I restriction enzyme S subunit
MSPDALPVPENTDTATGHDASHQLPKGWTEVRLQDVVEQLTDGTHAPPKFSTSGVPFIVIGNVRHGSIDWASVFKWVTRSTFENEAKRLCPRCDDILYTAVGSYGTAVRLTDDRDFMFQRHIAFLRPTKEIADARFLCHALNSPHCKQQADKVARGVAQKTVTLGSLRNFTVRLAPLCEQRRIAARIDELFAEIAEGEAALERARRDLDTWRRALLKAAVTGEVTRDWREANRSAETGAEFLDWVQRERDRVPRSKRNGHPERLRPFDANLLPDLPDGWLWVPLGQFVALIEAGLNVKALGRPPEGDEIGIVKVSAVTWGEFDELESKTLPTNAAYRPENVIKGGDFLISRANTKELVGAPVIVKTCARHLVLSDKVLRIGFIGGIDHWLEIFLKSPYGRMQIEEFSQGNQLSMHNISQDNIARIQVPIPPRSEIDAIVEKYDLLLREAEAAGGNASEAKRAYALLRQSILKAAFEGRLVAQYPTDEPASALLARLREGGAARDTAPRRRGRPRDAAQGALAL